MCQCSECNNPRILIEEPVITQTTLPVIVEGITPITVTKSLSPSATIYKVAVTLPSSSNGKDGRDGKDGVDGITPAIEIGTVNQGINPQVTNTGTVDKAVLNFVLPQGNKGNDGDKGDKGDKGDTGSKGDTGDAGTNGLTTGIKAYLFSAGGNLGSYNAMGNFQQGVYVDTGDTSTKRLRIKGYVTVGNMQNWTTLRITSSNNPSFSGSLVSQRVKHSEASLYVGQHEINVYIQTSDRYIGFTFSDTPGGNYNADGEQYGDYGLEVFILS